MEWRKSLRVRDIGESGEETERELREQRKRE